MKALLVNALYFLSAWKEADRAAAQIWLITLDELPVIVVEDGMVVNDVTGSKPSAAARKKIGEVKVAVKSSTNGKSGEDKKGDTEEEDKDVKEKAHATKEKEKKSAASYSINELFLKHAQIVRELQRKVENFSLVRKNVGLSPRSVRMRGLKTRDFPGIRRASASRKRRGGPRSST